VVVGTRRGVVVVVEPRGVVVVRRGVVRAVVVGTRGVVVATAGPVTIESVWTESQEDL
jgi:hypothetical protein